VAETLARMVDLPGVILFESCLIRAELGRYSFLTADPFAWFERQNSQFGEDPFAELREQLAQYRVAPVVGLPPFVGGAAGLLSYELGGCWEQLPHAPADEFQLPGLAVGLYDWTIAWDHQTQRAWLISHGFPASTSEGRDRRARERSQMVLARLNNPPRPHERAESPATTASNPLRDMPPRLSSAGFAPQFPLPSPPPGLERLTSNFSAENYLETVARVIDYIVAGDIFQANLSQRLLYPLEVSPLELYQRLRVENPATFAGYFAHDDWAIVSASPERFLQLNPEGEVRTRPIKGTRPRRSGPEADMYTGLELLQSRKDVAENVMIVDLLRNDLSRVCLPGSLRVPQLCAVETYGTVQHLVSEVRGQLGAGKDIWDLFAATFPGGSITGVPKVRAREIIAELEPTVRGPYCGSLFYAGFDGAADSSILIRTFTCRSGWVQCQVGGGIIADSKPSDEYEETLHKAKGMLKALRPAISEPEA